MPVPNLLTYTALLAMVPDYAGRADPRYITRVPDFIALGEARIFSSGTTLLRTRDMIVDAVLTVPAGSATVLLPTDWLAFSRVSTANQPRVEYMPPDELYDLPAPGDATRYTVDGGNFVYGFPQPASGGSLSVPIRYYQNPGNLGTIPGGSTWLLQKAPSVYLYAALLEGALWAKSKEADDRWAPLLEDAIRTLNAADDAAKLSGGRMRVTGSMLSTGRRG